MSPLQNILGKKRRKVLIWFATSLFLISACTETNSIQEEEAKPNVQSIQGETQGTTYGLKIVDSPTEIQKSEIDSILHEFDLSLSGYIPESVISQFNLGNSSYLVPFEDIYFKTCFEISKDIFKKTDGAFDPTVLPLMKIWGFLKSTESIPTQKQIDSTLEFVGFSDENIFWLDPKKIEDNDNLRGHLFQRKDNRLQLDFNAIAQGYSVDVLANYLRKKGCTNFYVEIGGEIYVEGTNPEGKNWRLGVDKPVSSNNGQKKRVISAVISLTNKGIATSGNYRKFYEKDGKIYAHTLNPKTGRPAENEILSTTVIAENTAIADGMATAFMVMGLKKAKQYLKEKNTDHLDVLIIYTDKNNELKSFTTEGMDKYL